MLRRLGKVLNLRPHKVQSAAEKAKGDEDGRGAGEQKEAETGRQNQELACSKSEASVSLSAAVQGHLCRDERYYLMNLAHLFPADLPDLSTSEFDTHMLRPEFVMSYEAPLSADAFSFSIGNPADK